MRLEWNSISSLLNTFWGSPLRPVLKRKQNNNKNSLPLPHNLFLVFNLRNQILWGPWEFRIFIRDFSCARHGYQTLFFLSIYVSMLLSACLCICPFVVHPTIHHSSIHLHHLSIICFIITTAASRPCEPIFPGHTICILTTFFLPWSVHGCPPRPHGSLPPWLVISPRSTICLLP